MNATQTFSISELRQNIKGIIGSVVGSQSSAVIMQRSKPKAVLVDFSYFNALEEMLFDITDSREAEKAKKEKAEPFSDYINKRWGKPPR